MKTKNHLCPNGCSLPKRKKQIIQDEKGNYLWGYQLYKFCPNCGALMPSTQKRLSAFFDIYNSHPELNKALKLLYKSEFEAAAREAFVILETAIKKKSGISDLHGSKLMAQAFGLEIDRQTGDVIKAPLIAINNLETESERNEQEGIKLMLMGFFQGPRNLYQHNSIGTSVDMTISIVIEASFFLWLVEGRSLTENGRWIRKAMNYQEVLNHMPRRLDRARLYIRLKAHKKGQLTQSGNGMEPSERDIT